MRWLRQRLQLDSERGFGLTALTVMAMPLLIGMLGISFDMARTAYLRTMAQTRADLAAQAGVALGVTNGEYVVLSQANADTAAATYCTNTSSARPNVYLDSCSAAGSVVASSPTILALGISASDLASMCNPGSGKEYGIDILLQERIRPVFLPVLGVGDSMVGPLYGRALLRPANC